MKELLPLFMKQMKQIHMGSPLGENMQIDHMAMGSPLGPIIANIFYDRVRLIYNTELNKLSCSLEKIC